MYRQDQWTFREVCFGTLLAYILIMIVVLTLGNVAAFAQEQQEQQTTTEKVEEVQQEVQSSASQLDGTTLATAGGIGIGGIALAREYINSKKLKESDKRTDRDTGRSFLYLYRLIQTMDALVPQISHCLDQPFNSDPMQKHITIRMKLAEDANSTAEYLMTQLNTVVPSMTPAAAVIVADASNQTAATQAAKQQETKTTTTDA